MQEKLKRKMNNHEINEEELRQHRKISTSEFIKNIAEDYMDR